LFQSLIRLRMPFSSSVTLRWAELRSLRLVRSANQRSTSFRPPPARRDEMQMEPRMPEQPPARHAHHRPAQANQLRTRHFRSPTNRIRTNWSTVACCLLHAEWLASEADEHLDHAGKIRLWEKIIETSLKTAVDAQGHLLSMQVPRSKGRGSRPVPHRANPQPEPAPLQPPGSQAPGGQRRPSERVPAG
jgi:hypothetical protein